MFEIWHKAARPGADSGEIVNRDHPSQNPPPLDAHSAAVIEWFGENVNSFVMEFGVMGELVKRLKLGGEELALFLAKANMIFETQHRIAAARGKEESCG